MVILSLPISVSPKSLKEEPIPSAVLPNTWLLKFSSIKVLFFILEQSNNLGHGKPVDWWTLGIFIYEMIAGIDPFTDEDPMAIYQKILKGKIKFPRNFDK